MRFAFVGTVAILVMAASCTWAGILPANQESPVPKPEISTPAPAEDVVADSNVGVPSPESLIGPQGPAGPQGPSGPRGRSGVSGRTKIIHHYEIVPRTQKVREVRYYTGHVCNKWCKAQWSAISTAQNTANSAFTLAHKANSKADRALAEGKSVLQGTSNPEEGKKMSFSLSGMEMIVLVAVIALVMIAIRNFGHSEAVDLLEALPQGATSGRIRVGGASARFTTGVHASEVIVVPATVTVMQAPAAQQEREQQVNPPPAPPEEGTPPATT